MLNGLNMAALILSNIRIFRNRVIILRPKWFSSVNENFISTFFAVAAFKSSCRHYILDPVALVLKVPSLTVRTYSYPNVHTSAGCCSEVVSFKLSDIGEGISEVIIKEWYVKAGDRVNQFDSICEVQSDKASVTITSRYDGIIRKIYYTVEDTAKVGLPLVDIELSDGGVGLEQVDEVQDQDATVHAEKGFRSFVTGSADKILTTPAVRRLAMENDIRLSDVQGTGKEGRILKEDLLQYIRAGKAEVPSSSSSSSESDEDASITVPQVAKKLTAVSGEDRIEAIKGFRRAMAKTMTRTLSVPHFGYCDEVDVSQLAEARTMIKKLAKEKGIRMSYLPFLVKAASLALLHFPILNASIDTNCENITFKAEHNIGIAMDTAHGLIVPNVKSVQNLSLLEVAEEINRLHSLGTDGQLGSDHLKNGTFTLSNIGSLGGTYAKPLILHPEVAIGAIGKIRVLPRFDHDGNLRKAHVFNVSWSADHRIIDGATMCRFSNLWKDYLENPFVMLMDMK